jgi:hypothetical protein
LRITRCERKSDILVRAKGLEPSHLAAYDPESYVSTIPPCPHGNRIA